MTDDFYNTLIDIEKLYWHKLDGLFSLVNPQKPEKGIKAIITRARMAALKDQQPIEQHLEKLFSEAEERTRRRLVLLSQCQLPKHLS